MGVLILGDVHGCYYTLNALLREHWQPEEETLILIGDLINKGPHSVKTFRYWLKLKEEYPDKVILIRGNHEQWFLESYRHGSQNKVYRQLCKSFENKSLSPRLVAREIGSTPLHYENAFLMVSHAGISEAVLDPFDVSELHGVLKNRNGLKRLTKTQVIGHNIIDQGKPMFKPGENAWYIDTGLWCKEKLSALRFKDGPTNPEIIQMTRKPKDNNV